jgi:plastocyanin
MQITGRLLIIALFMAIALVVAVPQAPAISFHGGNLTYAFVEIHIRNGTFDPAVVHVYKNATVVWVNPGPEEHAICIGNDISPPLLPNESFTKNFHEFGVYDYHCCYHPGERGRVIVR